MVDAIRTRVERAPGSELFTLAQNRIALGPLVDNGDILRVYLESGVLSGEIGFEGRILSIDGQISEWRERYTITSAGALTPFAITLTSGWIIGFSLYVYSGTITPGQCQAEVIVTRNAGALVNRMMTLAAGEMANAKSLGLGAYTSGSGDTSSGAPTIMTDTIANPAPGAEIDVTVPAGETWEPLTLRFLFTCSATVASREITVRFNDGTNSYMIAPSAVNQSASQARGYTFSDIGTRYEGTGSLFNVVPFPKGYLPEGYRILTLTANIQAADQYSGIYLNYRLHV